MDCDTRPSIAVPPSILRQLSSHSKKLISKQIRSSCPFFISGGICWRIQPAPVEVRLRLRSGGENLLPPHHVRVDYIVTVAGGNWKTCKRNMFREGIEIMRVSNYVFKNGEES